MGSFAERMRQCRARAELSQATVAGACGVSRSAVSQWESGTCQPENETLKRVASLYGVTVGWLIGEVGAQEGRARRPYYPSIRLVPIVTFQRAASLGEEKFRRGKGLIQLVHTDERFGELAFALRVEDRSMLPELQVGDIVFVEPEITPRPGDFVVGYHEGAGQAVIRKFRPHAAAPTEYPEVDLVALNPDWPLVTLGVDTPGRIVGTVTALRREMVTRPH